MIIKWYGHSSFLLTAQSGLKIFIDPCGPDTGYRLHDIEADIVTVSHQHDDHNYVAAIRGTPIVLQEAGVFEKDGVRITGIPSFHDEVGGKKRGSNLIFLFEMDGLRIAHLGDLGALPSEEAFAALGKLDVLLTPVGGTYTIDPPAACEIANRTCTRVLIPMHFQTPKLTLSKPLLGIEPLLSIARNCKIHKLNQSEASITHETLGEDRVLVLDYER